MLVCILSIKCLALLLCTQEMDKILGASLTAEDDESVLDELAGIEAEFAESAPAGSSVRPATVTVAATAAGGTACAWLLWQCGVSIIITNVLTV